MTGFRARALTVALVLVLLALLLGTSHEISSDGKTRFRALEILILYGRLSKVRYSLIGSLFATPLYYVGLVWKAPEFWCGRYNFALLVLLVAALHRILRGRLSPVSLRSFLLYLAAASMFANNQENFFGDMFTAVFVAIGIAAVSTGRSRLGWTMVVLGGANTPASIIGVAAVAVAESVSRRRWRYLLAPLAVVILAGGEAWIRRGSPFATGYEGDHGFRTILPTSGLPGFSYPLLLGLLGILFSFGKGLVWFAPGLLVPVSPKEDQAVRRFWKLSLVFVGGLIVVYAKWWAWYGGWAWGPRFFLFASVPASLALACATERLPSSLWGRVGVLAAILLSIWVGANGAVYGDRGLGFAILRGYAMEFLVWHVPEYTVLWHPLVEHVPISSAEVVVLSVIALSGALLAAPVLISLARDIATLPGVLRQRTSPGNRLGQAD